MNNRPKRLCLLSQGSEIRSRMDTEIITNHPRFLWISFANQVKSMINLSQINEKCIIPVLIGPKLFHNLGKLILNQQKASWKLWLIRTTRLLQAFGADEVPKESIFGAILIPKLVTIDAQIDAKIDVEQKLKT